MFNRVPLSEAPARAGVRGPAAFAALLALSSAAAASAQTLPPPPAAGQATSLDQVIVTASAFPESRSRIASTVQVIGQAAIQTSGAQSITDLVAESAGGFLSEWSADQSQINIRGGLSDGQGRDYLSDVLVLINGRRAGTANISKLSPDDIERIEIIRGPASVIYGSQNIGGVVNIILKTGRTTDGGMAELGAGSFGLAQGHIEDGGKVNNLNWFVGLSNSGQGDYQAGAGGGTQANSAWHRLGGAAQLGADIGANNRVDLQIRSDGCYSCGFRGSQANIYDRDNRANESFDLTYTGHTTDNRITWSAHPYGVIDEDDFNWASPIVVSNNKPVAGTALDDNRRTESVLGDQLRVQGKVWTGNTLLVGWDTEYSQLRSRRFRIGEPGTATTQLSPYDNNQHEYVNGLYAEDAQNFLDDRLTVRGGLRWTTGATTLDPTPFLTGALFRTEPYQVVTYSAGVSYKALDWLAVHFGASSGFRAPDATQLAGDFTAVGGGKTFGNPDLTPETSHQLEVGGAISRNGWSLDTALFQNIITNRISTQALPGVANTSEYVNEHGDAVVNGIEVQASDDLMRAIGRGGGPLFWTLSGNGYYNFDMVDHGAVAAANTTTLPRTYRYELSLSTRFGDSSPSQRNWSLGVTGLLRGPVWINPVSGPEYLLIGSQEFSSNYYIQKVPFWVMNLDASVALTDRIELSAVVRNVLNLNQSPIFFGLDKAPYLADQRFLNGGGPGNSMEGRNFEIRIKARF
jgi:vitamin B12 transporter